MPLMLAPTRTLEGPPDELLRSLSSPMTHLPSISMRAARAIVSLTALRGPTLHTQASSHLLLTRRRSFHDCRSHHCRRGARLSVPRSPLDSRAHSGLHVPVGIVNVHGRRQRLRAESGQTLE